MENLIYRGFIDVLVIIVVTIHVNFREAYLAIPKFGRFIYIHICKQTTTKGIRIKFPSALTNPFRWAAVLIFPIGSLNS